MKIKMFLYISKGSFANGKNGLILASLSITDYWKPLGIKILQDHNEAEELRPGKERNSCSR